MNQLREAAQMALDALLPHKSTVLRWYTPIDGAIDALTKALALSDAQSIHLDFKQATELLEMFGGEPTEITLTYGDGHSGKGIYASYTDMPEEGAEYLGISNDEAIPHSQHKR
jgi:hypothetical protein